MSEQGITYQPAVLPASVVDTLIKDDSIDELENYLWEFIGVDIQNANIKEWDFQNVLDMVDIAFINMKAEFKEKDWNDLAIVKYKIIRHNDGTITKVPLRSFTIAKMWDAMRTKAYLKMCRSRDGFMLRQLTENRGSLEQKVSGSLQPIQPEEQEKKKSRWRL